jgi:opacity protein-like surface antigen
MLPMTRIVTAAAVITVPSIGIAQWYIGGGIGQSSTSFNNADYSLNTPSVHESQISTKAAYKVFGGYELGSNWAVEGGYTSLGKPVYNYTGTTTGGASVQETSGSIAAKATLSSIDRLSFFGKFGLTDNKSVLGGSVLQSGWQYRPELLLGAGGEFEASKTLGIRLEYESYGKFGDATTTGRTNVDLWSVGVKYKF